MNELAWDIPGDSKKTSFLEPHLLLYSVEAGGRTLDVTLSSRLVDNPPQAVEIEKITAVFCRARGCPVLGRQDRGVNRKLFGKSATGMYPAPEHGN
jgi:hypothetical protein